MAKNKYPDILYSSDDFGGYELVLEPESFEEAVKDCQSNVAYGPDFEPEYQIWSHAGDGVYEPVFRNPSTTNCRAVWNEAFYTYELEQV